MRRVPRLLRPCRERRKFPMRDTPGDGVDYNDLPVHFSGIVHSCAGSAASYSIVDGQQDGGVFH